jgi:hypothetical protein
MKPKNKNMKDKLISFETAKPAKEGGFDWPTLYYHATSNGIYSGYSREKGFSGSGIPAQNWNADRGQDGIESIELFSAPTQSLLQKWLREVHNIHIAVHGDPIDKDFSTHIFRLDEDVIHNYFFKTYEEALEWGLQKALKLIEL